MQICLNEELYVFAMSAVLGAVFGCLSDFFAGIKQAFGGRTAVTAAADICFWIVFFSGAWFWLLYVNNGGLRFFELIGASACLVLYKLTAGRMIRPFFCFIIKKILVIIKFIFKILLTPAHFLYKIYVYIKNKIFAVRGKKKDAYVEQQVQTAETSV